MRKLYLIVILLSAALPAFSQLYKVENAEKEQHATLIIEGKVVEQTAFWNPQHTMIFTANKIKVYKLFKGEVTSQHVEILTQGGTVGNESVHASDLLELNKEEIGVFFCFPNQIALASPVTGNILYDVYASSQGYFRYDLFQNKVSAPFQHFSGITETFYPFISGLTKSSPTIIDHGFDVNNFKTSVAAKTNAIITSLSSSTVNGGATLDPANNVLTINGTGFGTASGSAAVLFSDGNDGGSSDYAIAYSASEMVSWSDNQIQVRVPTRACTGGVKVRDAAGTATSATPLTVYYSIITFSGKQSNLVNLNGSGGYTVNYSSNMTAQATATFNRAIETWIEVSGANLTQGITTSTTNVSGTGECVVMMDNAATGNPPLSAGVLGVCYSYNVVCGTSYDNRKPDFDIVLRSSYSSGSTSFSYGPCAPANTQIDLETVILHELGHALNLGHINDGAQGAAPNANPGKLMHYAVSNGVKRVSPDNSAYQGSLYAINGTTTNYGPCTAQTNMAPLSATVDVRDEMPLSFPAVPTAGNVTVPFDLEHATSNKKNDPPYNIILCTTPLPTGTNITNNVYLPIRTSATGGDLTMTVSDFQLTPASAGTDCTGGSTPTFRMAVFYRLSMPTSPDDYGDPIACRSFTGNGAITTVTGLLPNSTYLLYIDGRANAKGSFKITFNGTALPLKFEKFIGEAKKDHNLLTWSIATFDGVEKLVLQKSGNGSDFTPLHEQNSFETGRDYHFADYKPFAGKNYYRLAVYNKDGSVQYSSIVVLNNDKAIQVNVYPNPVRERLNISISTVEGMKDVQVNLFNSIGQLVISRKVNIVAGSNLVDVNTTSLTSGIYRLQVSDSKGNLLSGATLQK